MTVAKILVVEEEDVIRGLIRVILQNAGHAVVEAGTGDAGWQLLRRATVDAVVADCMGRVGDGLGLLKRMRADASTAHTPVIALCGLGQAGAEAGLWANAVVIKPFRPAHLMMKVEAALLNRATQLQPMVTPQFSGPALNR
jgi:DNA-binding response OmpR family regulator